MSDRARVEYESETLIRSHPAPLKPGEPGWSSAIGLERGHAAKGSPTPPQGRARIANAISALKAAMAERDALQARMAALSAAMIAAAAEETEAAKAISGLVERSRRAFAHWAENRHLPAPFNSTQMQSELGAIHEAAARKAAMTRDDY
jgi:hypothetical protein